MRNAHFLIYLLSILILASCGSQTQEHSSTNNDDRVILGIFGGMGPEATADLYKNIVKLTPADNDQDHIPTLIYSLPQVPDRMNAIENSDLSIIPYLVEGVTKLEQGGASLIAIPCNTVHYFYDHMESAVDIPIIHMIRETAIEVNSLYPNIKRIGLMATTGTISSRLYHSELAKYAYSVITPDSTVEKDYVMKAVFGIKTGTDNQINEDLLAEAAQGLIDNGAELLILGCTEIPLAFNTERSSVPVVNATEILASRAIELYMEINSRY